MNGETIHPVLLRDEELAQQCEMEFLRRSGPGGQHRNKVETAVRLRHRPTGVEAEASERRTQAANRRVAMERLRVNLALEVRLPRPPTAPPSPLWQSHCPRGRIRISRRHAEFPALLAEALDVVAAADIDLRLAAQRLGTTPSQLVKLFRKEPRALALVNRWRLRRGLSPLR
ncbi:MAG TPA: peptide chain release factor-like protein [Planctomycetaceae bacterium]|nr:peptide chain release factor-like protein [Planctomycetaceae bacterium]